MNFTVDCTDQETQLKCDIDTLWYHKDEVWTCNSTGISRCDSCQAEHEPNCPTCSLDYMDI